MVRCTACDLELEGPAESCPECGAPTRQAVIRVDTRVRDRYASVAAASASEDADFEYAFGGKRGHVEATTAQPVEKRRRRFRPRRAGAVEPSVIPVRDVEVIAEPDPVETVTEEHIADVGVHDLLEALRAMGAEDEGRQQTDDVVDVPDETELDDVNDEDLEDEPVLVIDLDEEALDDGATVDELVDEVVDEAEEESDDSFVGPDDVLEELEPVAPAAGAGSADEQVQAASTVGFAKYEPYVVLPTSRRPERAEIVQVAEPATVAVGEEPAPARRARRRLAVAVGAVLAIAAAVAFVMTSRGRPEPDAPRPPYTVASETDPISFRVPGAWNMESQGKGVLDLSDPDADAHVHATLIARKSLKDGLSLKDRDKQVRTELLRSLVDEDVSMPEAIEVGGHRAVRTEITATSVGQRVSYILTVVKTPKHFINVLAWSPADEMDAQDDVLARIVESLESGD